MGCTQSKNEPHEGTKAAKYKLLEDQNGSELHPGVTSYLPRIGPLKGDEYRSRLESSEVSRTAHLPHSNYSIKYAFVSQRGYYPSDLDKANQDAFCVHPAFNNNQEEHLFGVFDGHGEFGTETAQYARDKITENMRQNPHLATSPALAFHQAMVMANNQMHRSDIEDLMSGTTAIMAYIRGRLLAVANVGDSRAIMAERNADGKLVAVDLSVDQTPYRKDECERVRRCGAKVLTLLQLEGHKDDSTDCWTNEEDDNGDPPRLWYPDGSYPGTAFTRSIGDSAAERIGVFAEPEVVTRQLSKKHAFVVLASDGVWEFLSSQAVVDIVAGIEDPQEACYAVVTEAYQKWLSSETRTDDITAIIIRFSGLENELPQSAAANGDQAWRAAGTAVLQRIQSKKLLVRDASHHEEESMAVRRTVSSADEDAAHLDAQALQLDVQRFMKSDEEKDALAAAVRQSFLFELFNDVQLEEVINLMERVSFEAGQQLFAQGDAADVAYVISEGTVDVLEQAEGQQAEHVQSLIVEPQELGSLLGELALMHPSLRTCSALARSEVRGWQLHRLHYKVCARQVDNMNLLRLLAKIDLLKSLNKGQLQTLAGLLRPVEYDAGVFLARQGEEGDTLFIVGSGLLSCTVRKDPDNHDEPLTEVMRFTAGHYFGELALLSAARRAANVVTSTPSKLFTITRAEFEAVFGPLQDIIDSQKQWAEELQEQRRLAEAHPGMAALTALRNLSQQDLQQRQQQQEQELQVSSALVVAEPEDCCCLALVQHVPSGLRLTARVMSQAGVAARQSEQQVLQARKACNMLQPCIFVPPVAASFRGLPASSSSSSSEEVRLAGEVLASSGVASLQLLMLSGAPFLHEGAAFIAACVVCGLDHVHRCGVLYRSLAPDAVVLTSEGYAQLADFQFARPNDGRAYTFFGTPEYMAPEMVDSIGHNEAADWWALGVLVYALLSGSTPFAAPEGHVESGEDVLGMYRRIAHHQLDFPEYFAHDTVDLLEGLLAAEPNLRLGNSLGGVARIKEHPFFASVDWAALQQGSALPPQEVLERIAAVRAQPLPQLELLAGGQQQLQQQQQQPVGSTWLDEF